MRHPQRLAPGRMIAACAHREETTWNIRIEASAEFDADYQG